MTLNITFICGGAGTGKSTLLCKKMREHLDAGSEAGKPSSRSLEATPNSRIGGLTAKLETICLCETHSSKQNVKSKFINFYSKDYDINYQFDKVFKTIFSFFRINFKNNAILGPKNKMKTIFFDEFSLISPELFNRCLTYLDKGTEIMIFGDPLQLSCIETKLLSFTYLELQHFSSILEKAVIETGINPSPILLHKIILHLKKSLLFNIKPKSLGIIWLGDENIRATAETSESINRILDYEEAIIHKMIDRDEKEKLIQLMEQEKMGESPHQEYTFIGSTYEELQEINELINKNRGLPFPHRKLRNIYLYKGMKIYFTENRTNYYNGEKGIIEELTQDYIKLSNLDTKTLFTVALIDSKINIIDEIMPNNLITFHKSQGLSYKNTIISTSNLFDIPMLYTGLTRTINNFYFYGKMEEVTKNIREFNVLKKIIIQIIQSDFNHPINNNISFGKTIIE
jgi:ATP-dependent exoDNAse (exonuclease V) alpha subunit